MAKRKVKARLIVYYERERDHLGRDVVVRRTASRGEVVELTKEEEARLDSQGALFKEGEPAGDESSEEEDRSIAEMSVEELVEWLKEESPTVNEVIEASDGNADLARRLLDAESVASGGEPRKGVVEGLSAVIERGNQ